jgi:flagellar biosynthesis/type III secretory pathway chaperone
VQSTLTEGFGDLMTKQIRVLTSLLLVYAQNVQELKESQPLVINQIGSFKDKRKHICGTLEKTPCDRRIKFYVYLESQDLILS